MSDKPILYFIAIIPPQETCDEITTIKEDFASRFESRKALRVIPHITLKAPFKLSAADEQQTFQWFETLVVGIKPFEQELKNFGAFHSKRNPVIFVDPVMNAALHKLQQQILQHFTMAYPRPNISNQEFDFHPHITVAYRDLSQPMFVQAWKEYQVKKYEATFMVSDFHLLQHDGATWKVVKTFSL